MPAYTCTAVRNAIGFIGNPIIIDSDISNPNINVNLLNETKAQYVVVSHMYGRIVDLKKIKKDIVIVEDCAQSLGASEHLNGKISNISVFSFYATKFITSGGMGGMIVTKDKSLIQEAKDYRDFDQKADGKYRFNFQMTDIQAGIGRAQLKMLPRFVERRREIYNKYLDARIPMLKLNANDVPFRAIMLTDNIASKISKLEKRGIKAINPMESHEIIGNNIEVPIAHNWSLKTLSLPIYPSLTNDEIDYIIREVRRL